jgi:Domain of unknown function (DUF4908)
MRSGFSASVRARLFFAALVVLALTFGAGAFTPALAQRPTEAAPNGFGRGGLHPFGHPRFVDPPGDPGDMLFGRAPADTRSPTVQRLGRYRADTGDTFVLEITTGGPAFLKYDDSGEVWALDPTTGPRGDTIYKNDVGEPMLRATRLGGMTVFTRDQPSGVAAAFEGAAGDLHNMINGPIAILHALVQASARASQAAGRRVEFEAGCTAHARDRPACPSDADLTPGSEGVFADAANLAAQAFIRVDRMGRAGHDALARYDRVALLNGHPPSVHVVGDEVRIVVAPELGFAGRPSSQRISEILFRR